MLFRSISDALKSVGVTRIREVDSSEAALAVMRDMPPDLVVSAFYLPDASGADLVRTMRVEPDLVGIAFILVSSETRPQVLESVRQSGACAILPKPFSEAQLLTAMRSSMDYLGTGEMLNISGSELETLRVLLVDDSKHARNFIRRVLENLGIEHFVEASNGQEAVALLGETMVDLVITDYNMPEMDGKALVEYIRQQSWQSSVPILMVTSESNMGRLAAVEQAGVSAICDKPFEPRSVKALIERVLAG